MSNPPNLADPTFEPTDDQWAEILRDAGRVARWHSAMADAGVKVLALGLTPAEESRRALAWEQEQTGR